MNKQERAVLRLLLKIEGNDCWIVNESLDPDGRVRVPSTTAARALWKLLYRRVDPQLRVCHSCDNPKCIRPKHLFVATPQENTWDAIRKGRLPGKPLVFVGRDAAQQIRIRVRNGEAQSHLAKEYKISRMTVWRILKNLSWRSSPKRKRR